MIKYRIDQHVVFLLQNTKINAKKLVEKSSPPKLTREHSESLCHHNESCLEKTQIMPMIFLHTNAAKMATCAHINLALVWEKIAKGQLKKVDQYLYAVLRVRNLCLF